MWASGSLIHVHLLSFWDFLSMNIENEGWFRCLWPRQLCVEKLEAVGARLWKSDNPVPCCHLQALRLQASSLSPAPRSYLGNGDNNRLLPRLMGIKGDNAHEALRKDGHGALNRRWLVDSVENSSDNLDALVTSASQGGACSQGISHSFVHTWLRPLALSEDCSVLSLPGRQVSLVSVIQNFPLNLSENRSLSRMQHAEQGLSLALAWVTISLSSLIPSLLQ